MKRPELTEVEAEILAQLVAGKSAKQVAGIRYRSLKTVRQQIRKLKKKLGAATLCQLGFMASQCIPADGELAKG